MSVLQQVSLAERFWCCTAPQCQERPKSGEKQPRAAQEQPKSGQEMPKAAQERPKSGPKAKTKAKNLESSYLKYKVGGMRL